MDNLLFEISWHLSNQRTIKSENSKHIFDLEYKIENDCKTLFSSRFSSRRH